MNSRYIKIVILLVSLSVLIYLFQAYSIGEKVGRFINIVGNISHALANSKHAYEIDINITEDELSDINITKISREIKSSIDQKKDIAYQDKLAPASIEPDEIRQEERPTHSKAGAVKGKLVKLEDLPAKFKPLKKYLHEPFRMGACQICHINDTQSSSDLIKENIHEICYECHKTRYTKRYDHKPAKDGKCMSCHDPHQADTKMLLRSDSINNLCMKCHDKKSKFKDKADKKFVELGLVSKHEPIEKKSCLVCHDAHTAEHKMLLKLDAKMDLCLDCHDKIAKKIKVSKYKHGGVNSSKKRCLECHNPHASKYKKLLINDQVSICLKCHDKEVKSDEDGGMLMNIKQHLKENPKWHKPISDVAKEGGCVACHDSHGSENFSILKKSFTKNFYDDFENSEFFCFECHEHKKVLKQYTQDDKITKFRDKNVNLHYLHVNDKKGRSCRACHDEHASKHNHLLRDYTDFNGIKFPLRFIESENGGSCAPACHKKFEYDRIIAKSIGK